jgi:hypothetical protein
MISRWIHRCQVLAAIALCGLVLNGCARTTTGLPLAKQENPTAATPAPAESGAPAATGVQQTTYRTNCRFG